MHFKKTNFQPSYSWVVLASLILGIIVIPPIFSNISNLSYSLSTGRINNTTPAPLYGFVHLQTDKPDYKDNTFAGDFAVIYMPAKHFEDPDLYR